MERECFGFKNFSDGRLKFVMKGDVLIIQQCSVSLCGHGVTLFL